MDISNEFKPSADSGNTDQHAQNRPGGETGSFVALKREVTPENFSLLSQGRSDDVMSPDLRSVRYDEILKIVGAVESGHPAHEAVHMSMVEQITLQMVDVPPASRLVPLGSPGAC